MKSEGQYAKAHAERQNINTRLQGVDCFNASNHIEPQFLGQHVANCVFIFRTYNSRRKCFGNNVWFQAAVYSPDNAGGASE